ncbi:MAG: hypothetical protein HYZ50_27195 [Deltaproteobacteria bacterium]|nr:hypothetical protein [Deltaproteobacteria bacterium]
MKLWVKGVALAIVHVGIVASLGAKLLYDRATRPRVWALAAPYDPDLPIRGRYVRLQLIVEPKGIKEAELGTDWHPPQSIMLRAENDRLIAEAASPTGAHQSSDLHVQFMTRGGKRLAVLDEPAAFFIAEHIPDPSLRPADEELWVEVTVPKQGPPRPIRLGVKKGGGPIVPLQLE